MTWKIRGDRLPTMVDNLPSWHSRLLLLLDREVGAKMGGEETSITQYSGITSGCVPISHVTVLCNTLGIPQISKVKNIMSFYAGFQRLSLHQKTQAQISIPS